MTKVGRPTKYKPEIIKKTEKYFRDPSIAEDPVATISGLCCYLDVSRDTIYEWRGKYKKFSDTLKAGECFQEKQFMQRLLDKETFTPGLIFAAKNVLGWSDRRDIRQTGDVSINVVTGIDRIPGG